MMIILLKYIRYTFKSHNFIWTFTNWKIHSIMLHPPPHLINPKKVVWALT